MKNLFKLLLASLLLFTVTSCSDSDDPVSEFLEVTNTNLSGTWKLSSWNETEQGDNPYMYIVFNHRDNTFEMYQNMDSGKSRYITGVYQLVLKDGERPVIKGYYDHGTGSWSHDYHITQMTDSQMTWTITNNPDDVSVYTRADDIPEDVVNGTRGL